MTTFNSAWLGFKASEPGCFDDALLRRNEKDLQYLENRLSLAFAAGWNAAKLENRFPATQEAKP